MTLITGMLLLASSPVVSQPYNWDFAESLAGSTSGSGLVKMDQDYAGNIYVCGEFTDTRTFGPYTLTATGNKDIFVAKYDNTGMCQWAIHGGGLNTTVNSGGIVIHNGIIYITGSFNGSLHLSNLTVSTNPPNTQVYIALIDPSNGMVNVLKQEGGNFDDFATGICKSASGGFYITGSFAGVANFGSYSVNSGNFSNTDVFIAKYNAFGNCLWVKKGGSLAQEDKGLAVKEMPDGNVVLTGYFQGAAYFDTWWMIGNAGADIFLVCYNSAGAVQWATHGGSAGTDLPTAITTDSLDYVYVTGEIGAGGTFSSIYVPGDGYGTAFIAKYDSTGNCQWVKTAESFGSDIGSELVTDPGGNSYMVGDISGNANFSGTQLNGAMGFDGFVSKYDPAGNLIWVIRLANPGLNDIRSVLLQSNGALILSGEFENTMSLGNFTIQPSPPGTPTLFLTLLSPGTLGLNEPSAATFSIAPNPASDWLYVVGEGTTLYTKSEIIGIDGKVIQTAYNHAFENGTFDIPINTLAAGSYFLRLSGDSGTAVKRFHVIR
ncbi:MAG TPA: T9SS type A sorting domain-containing protein [Bacteroidia bacterium]|nr:T9SS type A sorting domain-containing protein [Bacteroidia bacterium]